jgi:hypothetical protein
MLMFKSENSISKNTSLTLLENIFTAKSVGVTANYVIFKYSNNQIKNIEF